MASDIFGVSGRAMLGALIAGQRDLQVLAQLARGSMRGKIATLKQAFAGSFTDHHAFLLRHMLDRIDALTADIAELDARIEEQIAPFADAVTRLDEIPGVGVTAAQVIIAEVRLDMSRFPTPAHLASWAPPGRLLLTVGPAADPCTGRLRPPPPSESTDHTCGVNRQWRSRACLAGGTEANIRGGPLPPVATNSSNSL